MSTLTKRLVGVVLPCDSSLAVHLPTQTRFLPPAEVLSKHSRPVMASGAPLDAETIGRLGERLSAKRFFCIFPFFTLLFC